MWSHAPTRNPAVPARRIVNRVADARVYKLHHGADDVARRPELAQFARLPDLAEHVLEQVALGVRVHPVEMQIVQLADDLREHGGFVDHEPRTGHEVGGTGGRELGVERKHFLAHPANQPLAVQCQGPRGPPEEFA